MTHPNAAARAAVRPVNGHAGRATDDRSTERHRRYRARTATCHLTHPGAESHAITAAYFQGCLAHWWLRYQLTVNSDGYPTQALPAQATLSAPPDEEKEARS